MVEPFTSNEPRDERQSSGGSRRKVSLQKRVFDWTIALFVFIAIFPLLAIISLLLFVIYHYHIQIPPLGFDQDDGGAYYVNFNSTRLITLASWASTLSPYVLGAIMGLIATPLSYMIRKESKLGNLSKLPTPWQLSLLLQLLNGGLLDLWAWSPFRSWRRRERSLPIVNWTGAVLLFITIVQGGILAADTWLHVATKTESQLIPVATPGQSYGRALNDSCLYDSLGPYKCRPANTLPREPYLAFHNISTQNQIAQFTSDGHMYQYIGDPSPEVGLDFTASTIAVESVCTSIGERCLPTTSEFEVNCSALFQGDLLSTNGFPTRYFLSVEGLPLVSTWFADSAFTILFEPFLGYNRGSFTQVGANITAPIQTNTSSPFHAAVAGNFPATDDEMRAVFAADSTFRMVNSQVYFAFDCLVTLSTMQYNVVDGQATSLILSDLGSNATSALLAQSAFSSLGGITDLGNLLSYGMTGSSLAADSKTFISSFSMQLGAGILSEMATVVVPQKNIIEQRRNEQVLISRIPFAPLWTLVGFCALSVIIGVFFSILAITYNSAEIRDIQARLNVIGIVSNWCEVPRHTTPGISVEDTFFDNDGERTQVEKRVEIADEANGGWKYRIIRLPNSEISLSQRDSIKKPASETYDLELENRNDIYDEQNRLLWYGQR